MKSEDVMSCNKNMSRVKLMFYKIVVNFISDFYGFLKIPYANKRFSDINCFRKWTADLLEEEDNEISCDRINKHGGKDDERVHDSREL